MLSKHSRKTQTELNQFFRTTRQNEIDGSTFESILDQCYNRLNTSPKSLEKIAEQASSSLQETTSCSVSGPSERARHKCSALQINDMLPYNL